VVWLVIVTAFIIELIGKTIDKNNLTVIRQALKNFFDSCIVCSENITCYKLTFWLRHYILVSRCGAIYCCRLEWQISILACRHCLSLCFALSRFTCYSQGNFLAITNKLNLVYKGHTAYIHIQSIPT